MRAILLTLFLMSAGTAQAEPLLHVGASAGIDASLYVLCTGAMGRSVDIRLPCLFGSAALTGLIAITSEVDSSVADRSPTLDTKDLAIDGAAIVGTSLLLYFLDIHGKKDKNMRIGFDGQRLTVGWRF